MTTSLHTCMHVAVHVRSKLYVYCPRCQKQPINCTKKLIKLAIGLNLHHISSPPPSLSSARCLRSSNLRRTPTRRNLVFRHNLYKSGNSRGRYLFWL
jgi:hypothetical protein